jgi:hypothetical protein
MQYSAPIFLGGMVRWGVDRWNSPAGGKAGGDEASEVIETETSPGVLLASGRIAGGSLAGVTGAFLELGSLPYLGFLSWIKDRVTYGEDSSTLMAWLANSYGLGSYFDAGLAVVVFGLLAGLLLLVGRKPKV